MQSVEPLIVLLDEGKEQGETLNIVTADQLSLLGTDHIDHSGHNTALGEVTIINLPETSEYFKLRLLIITKGQLCLLTLVSNNV